MDNPIVWSLTQHLNWQHWVNSLTISKGRVVTQQTQRWSIFSHRAVFEAYQQSDKSVQLPLMLSLLLE